MIEQLQQKNQLIQDEHSKQITELFQKTEQTVEDVRNEYTEEINELYGKVDAAYEERDEANLAKQSLEQQITRQDEKINRLTQKVSNLESILAGKENLIMKVNDENKLLAHRMENSDEERQDNICKIETILTEQTELREKD